MANATECGGLCEYVSMPNSLLPLCNSTMHYECSKDVFTQRVKDNNNKCRKQVSCIEFQYGFKRSVYLGDDPEDGWHKKRMFFEYSLETPQSSEGLRHQDPYKLVHTEYLIWIDIALIGSVGGTLGLTLGKALFFSTFIIFNDQLLNDTSCVFIGDFIILTYMHY